MIAYDPELQKTLDRLWFRMPDEATRARMGMKDADLGLRQQWLLRTFQSCARDEFAAVDEAGGATIDAERLRQVRIQAPARLPADFVPHGLADARTTAAIGAWSDDTARLRCPVIFQARRKEKSGANDWATIAQQGFAFHDELLDRAPRVFVRDFTGRVLIVPLTGLPSLVPVGTATRFGKTKRPTWGIQATAMHSLPAVGNFDPEHIVGRPWQDLADSAKSTFRVVAALAAVEADGVTDAINAYDSSVLSAGPYHYTAFPAGVVGDAELGAFLAYWASTASGEHAQLRDSLGIKPLQTWGSGLRRSNATFTASLGFARENGSFAAPSAAAERDYVRTYYLFYRVQHALRSSISLHHALWAFARQRVADVLDAKWPAGAPPGATKIGDAFKSELSIALLMRWHVFRPAHVVRNGNAGTVPSAIVAKAGLAKVNVSGWSADSERALANAFLAPHTGSLQSLSSQSLRDTLARVAAWTRPEWGGTPGAPILRVARDFTLDRSGIPFP